MTVLGDIILSRHLTVTQVSEESGIPRRTLIRYIYGHAKPSWENALKLYKTLNLVEYQFIHMMDNVEYEINENEFY